MKWISWLLALLFFSLLVAETASSTKKNSIILYKDTLWSDDVLLGNGDEVAVFSDTALTIAGTQKQPIRVLFQTNTSYNQPSISLYPNAHLVLEHVLMESIGTYQCTAVKLDKGSTIQASHWTCQNMSSCLYMEGSSSIVGQLVIEDPIFAHNRRVFTEVNLKGNITRSLFVNNGAIMYSFSYPEVRFSVIDSIFLNSSKKYLNGDRNLGLVYAESIQGCWFLNNSVGVMNYGSINECVFYDNQIGLYRPNGGKASNLTFIQNQVAIQAHSSHLGDLSRINLIQSTEFNIVSETWDTINVSQLYWGSVDRNVIQESIRDVLSGDTAAGLVQFEPYATEPFTHPLFPNPSSSNKDSSITIDFPTSFQGKPLSTYQNGGHSSTGASDGSSYDLPPKIQWKPSTTTPGPSPSESSCSHDWGTGDNVLIPMLTVSLLLNAIAGWFLYRYIVTTWCSKKKLGQQEYNQVGTDDNNNNQQNEIELP